MCLCVYEINVEYKQYSFTGKMLQLVYSWFMNWSLRSFKEQPYSDDFLKHIYKAEIKQRVIKFFQL